jgi:endonuclease/exonuclease/phosphatase family metal-dependent hydrolase
MKKIIFLALLFMVTELPAQQPLHVMTFNIRLNVASDSLNAWSYRKDKLASQVLFHQAELLGVQEALHDQMMDLGERLPQFKFVGVGRDDGKTKGEYSAIFYDTTRLLVLQSNTFWLSLTPEVPGSKSWDAAITRIVTWAKFKDRKTKKILYAFNTHFDHMGKVARKESALLLLQKIKEIAGTTPAVITGDFNAKPTDEPIREELSATPHYGPTGTFNGFRSKETDDLPIDYIFIKGKWKVLNHATISQTWEGRFASDHFSVLAELVL